MIQSIASKKMQSLSLNQLRSEPYRLLFPLGIALAAIGMGVWIPFYFWPNLFPFPGQAHATIQIQGFLLCFIFGFLTTMLPKVLGVKPLGPIEFGIFPIGILAITAAALMNAPRIAQIFHLLILTNFLAFIISRFPTRRADPPVHFIFIALAMVVDLLGTVCKIAALSGFHVATGMRAGSLLQFQAFPLLLILGVGGFLLPKLFANAPVDPKVLQASAKRGIKPALILSAFFLLSYAIEIWAVEHNHGTVELRVAYAIRALVWLWFLMMEIRIHKVQKNLPLYLFGARVSLIVMTIGMVMPVLRPSFLLAWEHVIFLSGFLRLTISIAARVLAAHSGHLEILLQHRKKTRIYGFLIVLAMFTRIASEFWPKSHWMHMAAAAAVAIGALVIWSKIYLPLLYVFPGEKT